MKQGIGPCCSNSWGFSPECGSTLEVQLMMGIGYNALTRVVWTSSQEEMG